MKKIIALALAACFLLALAGCDTAPKTETRYILTETVYEFAPDNIQKTVYHYTDDWVTSGYSVYYNDELSQEITMELDDQGYPAKATSVADGVTSVVEYRSTYDDAGQRTRSETWEDGELTSATDFTYEDGHLAAQTQTLYTAIGERTSIITFNADGVVTSQKNIDPDGNESGIDFTFNEEGKVVLGVNYYLGDGLPVHTDTVTEYDDQGRVSKTTVTDYDAEENVTRSYYTLYTYEGNTEIREVYDGEEVTTRTVLTYDDAGNLILNENTTPGSDHVTRMSYTYQAVEVPVE